MRFRKISFTIFIILLFSLISGKVFAFPVEPKEEQWCINFSSRYDTARSNLSRDNNQIFLEEVEDGVYNNSGVAWTNEVRFSDNIYSIYLTGSYYEPLGTYVEISASFEDDLKQHPLTFNSFYYPQEDYRNLRLKIFLATNDSKITPKVDEICLNLKLLDLSERGKERRDNERVRDLERMERVVERYHEDFNRYPAVNIDPREKENQWNSLKSVLDSASSNYFNNYSRGFIDQKKGVNREYQYGYLTENSGYHYLFWTELENPNSDHFQDSWKGDFLGVNCSPPVFCLYSGSSQEEEQKISYFSDQSGRIYLPETNFVKSPNDNKVWLVLDNYRFWIKTPEIFEKLRGEWNKIKTNASLGEIPSLKFIREEGKEDVYLVTDSGYKRKLPDPTSLYFYGQPSEIVEVEDGDFLDILPDNYLIRGEGKEKVYFLDQGIKRWISSKEVFEKIGFDWKEVVVVDPNELDYYPEGNPIF